MPPYAFRYFSGQFAGFCFLLQITLLPLLAADKPLAAGQVPPAVAQGRLTALGRKPATDTLRLAIGLPWRNRAALTNLLGALYDPASPEFHHFLTPAEFTARFGPTPADYAAVIQFAQTNGLTVTARHSNRMLLDVTGRVAEVERAFQVRLKNYRHPREARNFFAPDTEPVVDARLPVLQVSGLENYWLPQPQLRVRPAQAAGTLVPQVGSSPLGSFMGNDFRTAYVPSTPLTGAGQNVALVQFDAFYPADITNYAAAIGLTNNVPQIVVVPVEGGVATPTANNIEVALDIEMVLSMSPGVSNIYVYEAPNNISLFADVLNRIASDNLAKQVGCSWGGGGPNATAEQAFQQMAAQGQSFFNASGDNDAFTGAIPFPSDSPNITEVGGTTLTTDGNGNYLSETVWNWTNGKGSSGGVSTQYPIPIWQLGLNLTNAGGSTAMRNVPDVALTGDNVYVKHSNGTSENVGGTSCAAPLWAGLMALINQQAAQLGQPPVGFLNPALYDLARGTNYPAICHDIVTGNNTRPGSPAHFYAVPGFDLCTGWGTPNGTNLINALTTPDPLVISPATYTINGAVGGPFTTTNFFITLTNSGAVNLDWSLGGAPGWLAVAPTSGTLGAHAVAAVNVILPNANTLAAGNYLAGVAVTNQTLSRVHEVAVQLAINRSIVQNGGFETGDFTGWTLVGGTVSGNWVFNVVTTDYSYSGITDVVYSGYYGAFLGEGGFQATLAQTLATIPGQRYFVSCRLNNPTTGSGQQFNASWNGTNFISLNNPPAFTWTNCQLITTATVTNTVLRFAARNDPNYFALDDVSVTPLPATTFATFIAGSNNFQLAWNSVAGVNYQIQYKTNLAQGDWLNFNAFTAASDVTTFVDTNSLFGTSQRYYRLVQLP